MLGLLLSLGTWAAAQSLNDLFINVDTLLLPGAAVGNVSLLNSSATAVVSNSFCELPQKHFAVVCLYQSGKVMILGHEGILTNNSISSADNLSFLLNTMDWLNTGNQRIALKQGWVSNSNTSLFQNAIVANGYTFNSLSGQISSGTLANVDILILGNDWNGQQAYQSSELSAIDNFVANGGSILIAGLGWSWPQAMSLYPMNAVANLFGLNFERDIIADQAYNVNGSPKLYTFYPINQDTSLNVHCPSPFVGTNVARGDSMRVLKLAVSTTGEFTQQNGGVANTQQLVLQWLDKINTMYGREYAVQFELIANNAQLLFPNPMNDPWGTLPAGSGGCTNAGIILSRQAQVFDSILGASAYEISHVIAGSPFGGGCASGLKSGMSGGLNIPVTRHELGHQLAQSHTINYSSNSNYELEAGAWTVQGGNGHGRAHAASYHQLAVFLKEGAALKGVKIPTGNSIPTVDAGADYYIPIGTPFLLKASASDSDAGDSLTYVWDNMNLGLPQSLPLIDDSQGAWFMRLLPDTATSRSFPKWSSVLANNNSNAQEQLPNTARILDIRLTVNDNHKMLYNGTVINASGTHSDDMRIHIAEAGPFEVISQNTAGIIYPGGTDQLIQWAVNGTDSLPLNTQFVHIRLSIDGGQSFSVPLAQNVPNTGSALVRLPNISTSNARIQVSAANSIYFDVNTVAFEIVQGSIGLDDPSRLNIAIYPNPSTGLLHLDLPWKNAFELKLYNINGVLMYHSWNESNLNLRHLSKGLYILELIDLVSGQRTTRKIVLI